jgi:peroxiredoxin
MIRYILIFLIGSFIFFSCSKKNDPVVQKDTPKQQTQQQQQTQQPQQKSSPAMVDFSWSEQGKEKKLSDFNGSVILVNFWATWCPPCKKELPALSEISKELTSKKFKMVGVSVDDDKDDLTEFLKTNNLPYSIAHKPDGLLEQYMNATGQNQNVVPQSYIINKEGKVVEVILGARSKADFLSLINKYL